MIGGGSQLKRQTQVRATSPLSLAHSRAMGKGGSQQKQRTRVQATSSPLCACSSALEEEVAYRGSGEVEAVLLPLPPPLLLYQPVFQTLLVGRYWSDYGLVH